MNNKKICFLLFPTSKKEEEVNHSEELRRFSEGRKMNCMRFPYNFLESVQKTTRWCNFIFLEFDRHIDIDRRIDIDIEIRRYRDYNMPSTALANETVCTSETYNFKTNGYQLYSYDYFYLFLDEFLDCDDIDETKET